MYEKKVNSSKFFQSENVPSDPECQKFKSFDFKGVKYIPSGRLLVENGKIKKYRFLAKNFGFFGKKWGEELKIFCVSVKKQLRRSFFKNARKRPKQALNERKQRLSGVSVSLASLRPRAAEIRAILFLKN